MSGLVFYPKSHRYKLDGEWVPGVTTVIGVLDKPALRKWAASAVATYVADNPDGVEELRRMGRGPMIAALKETPWQKRDDAAARGTTFHDLAEQILNGQEVDVPQHLVPLVENALRFMEDYRIEPLLVEACVASREHRYAGKADLITDGTIWDWKSGKKIYPSASFQLSAYAFAEFHGEHGNEAPLPPIERAFGVHIHEEGYDVYPLEFGRRVFDEFLTLRRAYDINKRAEGDWRVPGTGYVGVPIEPEAVA